MSPMPSPFRSATSLTAAICVFAIAACSTPGPHSGASSRNADDSLTESAFLSRLSAAEPAAGDKPAGALLTERAGASFYRVREAIKEAPEFQGGLPFVDFRYLYAERSELFPSADAGLEQKKAATALSLLEQEGVFAQLTAAARAPRVLEPLEGPMARPPASRFDSFAIGELANACRAQMRRAIVKDDAAAFIDAYERTVGLARVSSFYSTLASRSLASDIGSLAYDELRSLLVLRRLDASELRRLAKLTSQSWSFAPYWASLMGDYLRSREVMAQTLAEAELAPALRELEYITETALRSLSWETEVDAAVGRLQRAASKIPSDNLQALAYAGAAAAGFRRDADTNAQRAAVMVMIGLELQRHELGQYPDSISLFFDELERWNLRESASEFRYEKLGAETGDTFRRGYLLYSGVAEINRPADVINEPVFRVWRADSATAGADAGP